MKVIKIVSGLLAFTALVLIVIACFKLPSYVDYLVTKDQGVNHESASFRLFVASGVCLSLSIIINALGGIYESK